MSAIVPEQQPVAYDPFAAGVLARVVPTTEPQREIWLSDQLGLEASLAYNQAVSLKLRGALDLPALQAAVAQLVERHDALRANFTPDGESLCIRESDPFVLAARSLVGLPDAEREAALQTRMRAAVETPFALDTDLLFRAELLQLQHDEHVLLMAAHHAVCDGWSWGVLVRELGALYAQRCGRTARELPPAESFADYASELAMQPPATRAGDEAYWTARFRDGAPVLDLPLDHARPPHRTFASLREDHVLDAQLVSGLRSLGARHGVSLFATLLAGFATLLSRIAAQTQVVVGIPAAGQPASGRDGLVGHCVNLLPLRLDLESGLAFSDALAHAQDVVLDGMEHQSCTFGTLLQALPLSRDPSRLPLVSVIFNLDQTLADTGSTFPGLSFEFETIPRIAENFELFLNAVQERGELRLECQYKRNLFDAETVRGWLACLETLLRTAVERPAEALGRLPLVDAGVRAQLAALQPAKSSYDREIRAHEFFEAQAEREPGRVAIVAGDSSLTYGALDARANRIARLLRAQDVGRGALVGIALDRDSDMLAAVLGVLKSGAGYVPLDPALPDERLAYMSSDAGLAALLTRTSHAARFHVDGCRVLALDALASELDALDGSRLARDAQSAEPGSVAYVIYTSGSTGRPKGVQIPHATLANFIHAMQAAPGLQAQDILLSVTTLSFDIAFFELMLPLSVGARIVLADREQQRDSTALRTLLENSGATCMQATPAGWRLLLESGWAGRDGFKAISGGEPLAPDLAEALLARCGEVWNGYGPTETTIYSTFWLVREPRAGIRIGRPVANTQVWILDEQQQLCPPGVPGELWIGGDGVGLGYLGRDDLTAERYIPDPFSNREGARLYRTGDRGRWHPDGQIEHLGRVDFQIKLRGYRIEPGEIEATLAARHDVSRALVVAREDRPGDLRLVAYVVAEPGCTVVPDTLIAHLRHTLPEYMVPQHVTLLPALPLLPNGKIDRGSLPAPEARVARVSHVAPRTPLETTIAAAMSQVLGLPDISVEDDFFALGGHSLLAAQLIARLGRELDLTLSLRALFDAPTVARLAALIEQREDSGERIARARIPRRADQRRAPLSFMQRRLWVLEQIQPGRVTYNTPSAHRLRGPFDRDAFQRAFTEVVRRQPTLRTIIVPEGDDAVQLILDEVDTRIPFDDLSALPRDQREAELQRRISRMSVVPFQLDKGPLFRAHLFRLADDEHALFFMPHHVIWDGWSFDLLYVEMAAHYAAFCEGRESPLPPLPLSYGDFADWHLQWLRGEELAAQVAHWKQHLAGSIEPLRLPQDFPRPAEATGEGNTHWLSIGGSRTDATRALATRCDATLFMTLLAAYFVLLHRLGGQRDIVVGLPVRNRNDEALEPLMGFFVNMVPLRIQLDPAMSFDALVKQVKSAVIEAFEYPDVPFEQLVRELGVTRDPSRAPLCQAMFSFQDARQRPAQWGGLRHERIDADQGGAEQDIGLWFLESADDLSGGLRYNTDIISEESARRFVDRYCTLLDAFQADPSVAIGDAELMSAEDRATLDTANETALALPRESNVHALLRVQARRTPNRIAVTCEGESIHYVDLQHRSDAIAAALRARGVEAGDHVGVCLERSIDLVASLIAVWKAGAAYVPLDPEYPAERLRFMADDAKLAQVVSRGELADPLQWPAGQVLRLDADDAEIAAAPRTAEDVEVSGEAPAYVIYTSGSTGKPKGVRVPHRAVVNFLHGMRAEPGLYEGDRLLAVTTTSFDISVLELFLPLSVGAQVLLATSDTAHDGELLARQLEREGATVMQATPTTWRMLLESGWTPRPGFRALCGGEPLAPDLAAQLAGKCELWNMYGPTETTVWSSCEHVKSPTAGISVGRPIANTQIHVVDGRGQPCAPGVAGEIVIGGLGVTLGYLDRPELTGSRFVEDRWSTGLPAGAKAYRTGDLGRWRMDGRLEHIGRLDHQIKLRGHRIELGEIECALLAQPSVARATVIAREDRPGDVRLVAYAVPQPGAAIDAPTLLAALRRTLPNYMVPQYIVPLAALPLLPNGKIDRNALPIPLVSVEREGSTPAPEQIEDPRTAYLAGVWSELLGMPVGPTDNFFDLGGHSMLAVQMASRVARDTGVRIKLVRLMVADLSQIAAELPETTGGESTGGLTTRLARNFKRLFGRPVASAP